MLRGVAHREPWRGRRENEDLETLLLARWRNNELRTPKIMYRNTTNWDHQGTHSQSPIAGIMRPVRALKQLTVK